MKQHKLQGEDATDEAVENFSGDIKEAQAGQRVRLQSDLVRESFNLSM